MGGKLQIAVYALGLVLAVSGCGGSTSPASSEKRATADSAGKAHKHNDHHHEDAIPRPLYPRCGVEEFPPPTASRAPGGGWKVSYLQQPTVSRPTIAGAMTLLTLQERPPKSTRVRYPKARTMRVRGRKVDYIRLKSVYVLQWVTKRARYVTFANGRLAVIRKLIACTP